MTDRTESNPLHTLPVHIAQAELEDVPHIVPLFDAYRIFYGQSSDPAQAARFLKELQEGGHSVIFFAYAGSSRSDVLGFTQLYPSFSSVSMRPIWILNDLFVASSARGRGVGRRLMQAAKEYAEATGALRLELSTARDNHTAQRLYESLGYVRDETFYHYSLNVR
ncbi:GNAT family N-acetyltransferase [Paenibacillus sp. P26]|nr:GNAT family N-acetyltransferase [Paenibacillus sp. P26]